MCARGCRGSRSTKAMDTPEKLVSFETLITDLEISLQGQHISSLNLSPMTPPPPPVRLTEQTHQELGFSLNDFPLISCFIREFFFYLNLCCCFSLEVLWILLILISNGVDRGDDRWSPRLIWEMRHFLQNHQGFGIILAFLET